MIGVAAAVVFLAALVRQVRDRLPGSLLADVVLGAGILLIAYQWLVVTQRRCSGSSRTSSTPSSSRR